MTKPEDRTVLVVDDEDDIREYFATVLEDAGFNVMTAIDGNEAIERMKEKKPDYISLDLVMPNKSGLKLLREMRRNKEWATIPFVIVTAHATDELGREDLRNILADKTFSGQGIYLEKPIIPEEYLNFICNELNVTLDDREKKPDIYHLKHELEDLIDDADAGDLNEIIKLLKQKKKREKK